MSFEPISGYDLIQFIRLLGELRAVGLTEKQMQFLQESADMDESKVNETLVKADIAYETIKDLVASGYQILPPGRFLNQEQRKQVCSTDDRLIEAIVFPTPDQLDLDEYSDDHNELFDDLLVGGDFSLGSDYGLYYRSLFTHLPFVAEGDIPSDECQIYIEEDDDLFDEEDEKEEESER